MTYPDRETKPRRWIGIVVLIFLVLYVAFAVEAKTRQQVCVSAMMADSTGTTVYPEICE